MRSICQSHSASISNRRCNRPRSIHCNLTRREASALLLGTSIAVQAASAAPLTRSTSCAPLDPALSAAFMEAVNQTVQRQQVGAACCMPCFTAMRGVDLSLLPWCAGGAFRPAAARAPQAADTGVQVLPRYCRAHYACVQGLTPSTDSQPGMPQPHKPHVCLSVSVLTSPPQLPTRSACQPSQTCLTTAAA